MLSFLIEYSVSRKTNYSSPCFDAQRLWHNGMIEIKFTNSINVHVNRLNNPKGGGVGV